MSYDPSDPPGSKAMVKTSPEYLDDNINLELVEEGAEVAEDETRESATENLRDPDPELSADNDTADVSVVRNDPSPETSAMSVRQAP